MKSLVISFFIFLSNILFANVQDSEDPIDYSRTGDYFPYVVLTEEDSLIYPITYEIELYVQHSGEKHHSSGVYSIINDEWLVEPVRKEPNVDIEMVKKKAIGFFCTKMEKIAKKVCIEMVIKMMNGTNGMKMEY